MSELKKPLQAILIAEDLQRPTIAGSKKITIREGHRDYRVGEPVILCDPDESFCVKADITGVRHCRAYQVTEEEMRRDGYNSLQEVLESLRTYYPDLSEYTNVTIITWDNVEGILVDNKEELLKQP